MCSELSSFSLPIAELPPPGPQMIRRQEASLGRKWKVVDGHSCFNHHSAIGATVWYGSNPGDLRDPSDFAHHKEFSGNG